VSASERFEGVSLMIELKSVRKPQSSAESAPAPAVESPRTRGHEGAKSGESRALKHVVVKGKSDPIARPVSALESVIGPTDERVRILATDLAPWRMICALRMQGPSGAGAIGTGWFIGPKTVLTAGHCVFSTDFFDGWATSIEVIPGLLGAGSEPDKRPHGSVVSQDFSSVDRWTEDEDADFDIGCIHLTEAKGEEVGWFALAALTPEELADFLVNISGYPADRGGGNEQYHSKNRVLRVTERRIFYDVDTFGGQSGAPVWVHETDDAPPLAVGIHAYGTGGTPSAFGITANSSPRIIPEVLEKVTEWVEQDGGWPDES
jgi:V8-like Glu-specific endopeptidase